MKLPRTILLILTLLPLTACGLSSDPIEGQVLEAGTKKPLAGAIVVIRWEGTSSQIAESKTVCYHVETATTDAQGNYRTPAWRKFKLTGEFMGLGFTPGAKDITAYKPGYSEHWPAGYDRTEDYKKNVRYLEPFKGTGDERLKYLMNLSYGADCYGANEKPLFALQKALYQEAKRLAVTPQDQDGVQRIKHRAAGVWNRSEIYQTDSEIETLIRNDKFLSEQLK